MIIAVTSQNFRTITGHAGKTRRFLIYRSNDDGTVREMARLDLPKEMAMHAFRGTTHPLDGVDVLITGGCGQGFIQRMASRGTRVVVTSAEDPQETAEAVASGRPVPPPRPHEH
jgi:predicted Fe-Mo cluster-binding NifX family protein